MADTVYLKKDIAADKPFENHPNLIFGLIFAAAAIFILASLIVLTDYLPTPIVVVVDLAIIAGLIYWIVKKNRKSNLSANEAFVKREGHLYYLSMGYFLENEDGIDPLTLVICGPKTAMDSMRASENLRKSSYVEEARKQAGTFTKALDYILGSPMTWAQAEDGRQVLVHSLPPYITSFYEMINPRLEKQDGDWIWISYESGYNPGIRVTGQYRNAYDLSMLDLDD